MNTHRNFRVCLEQHLKTWSEGDLNDLVVEGRTLQKCLGKRGFLKKDEENISRSLMFKGNTSAALQLLSQSGKDGVMHANDVINANDSCSQTILEVLKSKHPQAEQASTEAIQVNDTEIPQVHPLVFNRINA